MRTVSVTRLGAILAGGLASRFGGRAKGAVRVGGRRVVDRVYEALRGATSTVLLVSSRVDASTLLPGVVAHPDRPADGRAAGGSLGGLYTALVLADECGAEGVWVVAWDMPFVTSALFTQLRLWCDGMAAVPVHAGGAMEPLCGWYATACRPAAERLLEQGEQRAAALAELVGATRVPAHLLGDAVRLFTNINTPNDLVHARRRDRGACDVAALA